ncbi:MAG: PleD family two-component system response regulator [Pseudanabaenaceae cyanobacterium]
MATQITTRKVLVIDDSRAIRGMIKDMLPPQNFIVFEAKDGVEGLDIATREMPWLIMLDFIMPKMSGFQVYEALQQHPELSRIPLIIMSGRKEEVTEKIPEPFDEKYLAFMSKPFDKSQLFDAIKKAVTLAQKRPATSVVALEPVHTADSDLAHKVVELEARVAELEKRLAIQQRQIQQLAHYLKEHNPVH